VNYHIKVPLYEQVKHLSEEYFSGLKSKVVIVGHGMVASACRLLTGWDDDIIYASGVSNSSEQDQSLYDKEIGMIREHLSRMNENGSFVYFSTLSILDPSKSANAYIRHKLFIESMLRESDTRHLIIRLPNLVGKSSNPHTLTNFFARNIRERKPVNLVRMAVRHLIDADDLGTILNGISSRFGKNNVTVNVETTRPLTAGEILSLMEEAMNIKAEVIELNQNNAAAGNKDVSSSANYIFETSGDYHRNLINKYYASR
jgi:nucleoside-diphosphate-sugar epimerase